VTFSARPVVFRNRDGLRLFGMLHLPESGRKRDAAILILSPGIKSRIAPHRLYVKMADRFTRLGFPVFRFDYAGLGDSEGEVSERYVADFYGSIQRGRYVNDVKAAMDWMEAGTGIRRFILAGLCGGAITGLLAGSRDQRIDSVAGLGIPVILDGTDIDYYDHVSSGQLGRLREKYLGKLLDPKSWIRLVTLQTDYRLLAKSLFRPFLQLFRSDAEADGTMTHSPAAKSPENGNFNRLFPSSFFSMVSSGRRILLVFSEKDRLYWEFDEKFRKPFRSRLEEYRGSVDIHVTKDANHIFSFPEWQEDMMERVCEWLEVNYP